MIPRPKKKVFKLMDSQEDKLQISNDIAAGANFMHDDHTTWLDQYVLVEKEALDLSAITAIILGGRWEKDVDSCDIAVEVIKHIKSHSYKEEE